MKEKEKIIKAFANRRRLEIVKFLKPKREASVGEIAEHLKLSIKATSKHLGVLHGANIVEKEQRSLFYFYYLADKQVPVAKAIISNL